MLKSHCICMFTCSLMIEYFREMCLWDISDGRCIEHTKMAAIHTDIMVSSSRLLFACTFLFACKNLANIHDASTRNVMGRLRMHVPSLAIASFKTLLVW